MSFHPHRFSLGVALATVFVYSFRKPIAILFLLGALVYTVQVFGSVTGLWSRYDHDFTVTMQSVDWVDGQRQYVFKITNHSDKYLHDFEIDCDGGALPEGLIQDNQGLKAKETVIRVYPNVSNNYFGKPKDCGISFYNEGKPGWHINTYSGESVRDEDADRVQGACYPVDDYGRPDVEHGHTDCRPIKPLDPYD